MSQKEDSISLLKIYAAILVIILHSVFIYLVKNTEAFNFTFITTAIISVATRACLAIFVMISGRYLLSKWKDKSAKEFYKNKIPRILIPLVVWNIVYLIFRFATEDGFTLSKGFQDTINSGSYVHLWYFYLLFLLYLLTPLLNKVINKFSKRNLIILTVALLLLGSVAEFIRTLTGFKNLPIYYPVEFIGYYLAGYTLKDYKVKFNKYYLIGGYIVLAIMGGIFSIIFLKQGNMPMFIWFNMSVNPVTLFGSIFLYLFASNTVVENSKIASLSKYNLGIYVIHLAVLNTLIPITNGVITGIDLLDLALLVTITFIISLLLSILLYRNKYTRRLVS